MSDDIGLDLLRGTLDLLVLKSLAGGALHGYAVSRWVKAASRNTLNIEDRALYVALHRLEARKLVRGRWQTTQTGRRGKSYELTEAGRQRLLVEESQWKQYVRAMGFVLRAHPLEGTP